MVTQILHNPFSVFNKYALCFSGNGRDLMIYTELNCIKTPFRVSAQADLEEDFTTLKGCLC